MTVQVSVAVLPQPLTPTATAAATAQAIVTTPTALQQLTLTPVAADNFNRANGPLGGSNGWAATGDGNPVIVSNEASGVGSALAGAYRLEGYTGDQYAQGTVGSVNNVTNDFVGLTLRHNPATNAEYGLLYYFNGSSPVFNVYYRLNVGAYTLIKGILLGGPLAVGTLIEFYVIGNVLVALINGVPQIALIDNNIPPGGSPGLITFGTMTLDNFQCGNASMGTPLGPPIASDSFNRANGNASTGQAGWTPVTVPFSGVGSVDGVIVNNELNVSDSQHHTAQRNEVFDPNQWASLGVGSIPPLTGSGAFIGVVLRWNGTQGYMFCYFLNGASYRIYFIKTGSASQQIATVSANPAVSNPANTLITGVANGSRLSIQVNTCEVLSVTDTRCTAGQPCYQIFPTTTADNFAAGNVVAVIPPGPVNVTGTTALAKAAATATVTTGATFVQGSTDGNGVVTYNATSPIVNDGSPLAIRVLAPTSGGASGLPHNFLFMLVTEAWPSDSFGDPMGDVAVALNLANKYNVTVIAANLSGACWYGNSVTDPNDQRVTYFVNQVVPWVASTFGTGSEQNLLIGFSRSGMAAQDLMLHNPTVFAKAASWDFPAQGMVNYNDYGADIFGNQGNFTANYQLSTANVTALKGPFTSSNRIWIGGYNAFQTDVQNYDALLTSLGIPHTLGAMVSITHEWESGWVEPAVQALVGYASSSVSDNFNRADGAPGSGWVTMNSHRSPAAIVSNQLVFPQQSPFDQGVIRTEATWNGDHYSEIAAPLTFTGNAVGPAVRMQGTSAVDPTTPTLAMYSAIWLGSTSIALYVTPDGGNFTQLGSTYATSVTPGDRLRLTVTGSTLVVTLNGTPIITATDTSITGGKPGILANTASGTMACDNWAGGNVSSGTPSLTVAARGAAAAQAVVTTPGSSGPSDNFNRADGTPGTNWLGWGTSSLSTMAAIASGQLVLVDHGSADSAVVRNAAGAGETYASNQFSEVAAPTTLTGNAIGPSVRNQGGTNQSMYVAIWYSGNIGLFPINSVGATGASLGGYSGPGATPTPGDKLRLTATGSTLTVTLNGTTIITATDSTLTGGVPGIAGNGAASCDNWFGG